MSALRRQIRVVYGGEVQGVGFRYTARSLADGLGVAGGVENINDGTVRLVAEGSEEVLPEASITEISGFDPEEEFPETSTEVTDMTEEVPSQPDMNKTAARPSNAILLNRTSITPSAIQLMINLRPNSF